MTNCERRGSFRKGGETIRPFATSSRLILPQTRSHRLNCGGLGERARTLGGPLWNDQSPLSMAGPLGGGVAYPMVLGEPRSDSSNLGGNRGGKLIITVKDVDPPSYGPCGQFHWKVKFEVTGNPGPGFIIQKQAWTFRVHNCPPSDSSKLKWTDRPISRDWEFAEAFLIKGDGTTYSGPYRDPKNHDENEIMFSGEDEWTVQSQGKTWGWWEISAWLSFESELPSDMHIDLRDHDRERTPYPSQGLPAMKWKAKRPDGGRGDTKGFPPDGPPFSEIQAHRHAYTDWDCCDGETLVRWGMAYSSSTDSGAPWVGNEVRNPNGNEHNEPTPIERPTSGPSGLRKKSGSASDPGQGRVIAPSDSLGLASHSGIDPRVVPLLGSIQERSSTISQAPQQVPGNVDVSSAVPQYKPRAQP